MRTKVHEKFLYEIWQKNEFISVLETASGEKVEIISPGEINSDKAGPDFKKAKVAIRGIVYVGDIEIDFGYADWKGHGHNINKHYNSVILHITAQRGERSGYVSTEEKRRIPSISIFSCIKSNQKNAIQAAINSERKNRIFSIPCLDTNELVNNEEKLDFLLGLGMERLQKKCVRKMDRLKELSYLSSLNVKEPMIKYELGEEFYTKKFDSNDFTDPELWQQLIHEGIFEALGFTQNKDIMRRLAQLVDIKFLKKLLRKRQNYVKYAEAAFFVVAGLVPGEKKCEDAEGLEYIKNCLIKWDEIKGGYTSKTLSYHQWNFMRLRPHNFPTTRICGGVALSNRLLNHHLIEEIITLVVSEENLQTLHTAILNKFIVKAAGFWSKRCVLENEGKDLKYFFVADERATDILMNEIYPILIIYFQLFGNEAASKKVQRLCMSIPNRNEIKLATQISRSLRLNDAWKMSIVQQGMLDLYRNYCMKHRCTECKIGDRIFN